MKREIHTISEQMGTPLEYYKETQRLNRLFQLELQREFANQEGILGSSVALIVPGSDGRLEKGSDESPLEIIRPLA